MEALQAMMEASDESDEGASSSGSELEAEEPPGARKRRRVYSDSRKLDVQKAAWLLAPEGTVEKGAPLRCLLCNGVLLLNSGAPQLPVP